MDGQTDRQVSQTDGAVDSSSLWSVSCSSSNLCSLFKPPPPLYPRWKFLRFPNVTQRAVQLTADNAPTPTRAQGRAPRTHSHSSSAVSERKGLRCCSPGSILQKRREVFTTVSLPLASCGGSACANSDGSARSHN